MRRFQVTVLATVAVIGFASVASAADMPVNVPMYTKAPVAAPSYSWTGFYAGLNAGGNWGRSNDPTSTVFCPGAGCYFAPDNALAVNSVGATTANTSGFTGGIQGGYNWQSGNFVTGVEADFQYFRSAGSNSVTAAYPASPGTFTINSSVSTDWLFTLRPRLGFAANNWLFYGTGGLAVTQLKANWTFTDTFSAGASESASLLSTRAGWVVGGGLEYMLPGRWSLGAEYLYVKFGSISTTSTNLVGGAGPTARPGQVFTHSADLSSNIVRVRLNKLF